jgi:hypothetical protein
MGCQGILTESVTSLHPNGRGGQGVHEDALNLPAPCYGCCAGRLKLSTTRYYWHCCVRPLLLDGPVLLVLRCRLKLSTTRYYWYCCVRLLLLDGPVLLVLRWPSQAVDDQILLQRYFPPNR